MDSPVVVDTASEFGRGIDLDRGVSGFPWDCEDGFGRRGVGSSDIRSHLDDLASRHPEFADHLLGDAWGDVPAFQSATGDDTGSWRNRRRRRRDSGCGDWGSYCGQPADEEDGRSQASGSSGASVASGASGVSSHGGHAREQRTGDDRGEDFASSAVANAGWRNDRDPTGNTPRNVRKNPIGQYGGWNTVDIGQHRHEIDKDGEKMNCEAREQRSMSAPPENHRQGNNKQGRERLNDDTKNLNQKFVSRVDIMPQFVGGTDEKSKQSATGAKQQKTPPQQQQPKNVRHIPIFVEDREELLFPKNTGDKWDENLEDWSRPIRNESPPAARFATQNSHFSTPPQFQRPSHSGQHYGTGTRSRDWMPYFEEEFQEPWGRSTDRPSGMKRQQRQPFASHGSPPTRQGQHFRQPETRQPQSQPHQRQQQPQPQQQQQQEQRREVEPEATRKQTQPKDPLEKVAEVQKEIDSLRELVAKWNGTSRKDKDYVYLDEMLTRELIKLDDIETEGKENVRQARKDAIKSIQSSISLLESKADDNGEATMTTTMAAVEMSNGGPEIQSFKSELAANDSDTVATGRVIGEEDENFHNSRGVDGRPVETSMLAKNSGPLMGNNVNDTTTMSERDNDDDDVAATIAIPLDPRPIEHRSSVEIDIVSPIIDPSTNHDNIHDDMIQQRPVTETVAKSAMIDANATGRSAPEMLADVENAEKSKETKQLTMVGNDEQQRVTAISNNAIPLPPPPESH